MTALHTDPLTLPKSSLASRFSRAIDQAVAAQASAGGAGWESRPHHRVLALDDGTLFIPDMEDAKAGSLGMIFGGLALVFGLAFAGIFIDGKQAEVWMPWAAAPLIALGGYVIAKGRQRNRAARALPRVTGGYLLSDALLHVGELGCRVFPAANVRGFVRRSRSGSSSWKLFVRYVDEAGREQEADLFYPDASATLDQWLERPR